MYLTGNQVNSQQKPLSTNFLQRKRESEREHKRDLTRPLTLSKNSCPCNRAGALNGWRSNETLPRLTVVLRPCCMCGNQAKPANILWPIQFPPEGNFRLAYDRRGCRFASGLTKRVAFPSTLCTPGERPTDWSDWLRHETTWTHKESWQDVHIKSKS